MILANSRYYFLEKSIENACDDHAVNEIIESPFE